MWRCGGGGLGISGLSRVFPLPKHLPANTRFGMAESGTALGIWVRVGICDFGAAAPGRTGMIVRTSPCAMVGILHREALDLPISMAGKWRNRAHSPSTALCKDPATTFSPSSIPAVGAIGFPFTPGSSAKLSTFQVQTLTELAHADVVIPIPGPAAAQRPARTYECDSTQTARARTKPTDRTSPSPFQFIFLPPPTLANTDPWNIL